MILNQHQIPRHKARIHAARRIGQNQRFYAEQLHQPDRVDNRPGRMPLIAVQPPLHTNHLPPGQPPRHKAPHMVGRGGYRHVRYLPVRDNHRVLNAFRNRPQPGAEHQPEFRLPGQAFPQGFERFLKLLHGNSSKIRPVSFCTAN